MKYIVNASELYRLTKEIVNDGMDYVEISLMEPDDDLPAAVHFEAARKAGLEGWEDYEDLEVVNP